MSERDFSIAQAFKSPEAETWFSKLLETHNDADTTGPRQCGSVPHPADGQFDDDGTGLESFGTHLGGREWRRSGGSILQCSPDTDTEYLGDTQGPGWLGFGEWLAGGCVGVCVIVVFWSFVAWLFGDPQ
jgi:hypothetical protein